MSTSSDVSPLLADRWAAAIDPPAEKAPSMRVFGLVMLAGFGLLGALALLSARRTGAEWRFAAGWLFIGVAVVVFVWSLASPASLPPVYRAWMRLGQGLGAVVSTVLLSVLYVVAVAPIGWVMRLTGTDPLDRRLSREGGTYWRPHPVRRDADDYLHMS